jgi:thioredoxin-related protein
MNPALLKHSYFAAFCTPLNSKNKINTMPNKFFLAAILSLSVCLSYAQTSTRSGAQQSGKTTLAPRSNSGSVGSRTSGNNTVKQNPTTTRPSSGKSASTESKTGAQDRSNTTSGSGNGRSGKGTTAKSTTKAPATIPAITTRGTAAKAAVTVKQQPVSTPAPTIKWLTVEEALEKSKTEKRKIFVDVYTDWCGWCKHMDSTTFKDAAVVNYINEKYYPVKFNAEQTADIIYKGKTYKLVKQQGGRGYHELAALWLNNRLSYPTTVVLNEDQDLIQPIQGYQDNKKMDAILHYFGTDNHKKTPWEKYEKNYARER